MRKKTAREASGRHLERGNKRENDRGSKENTWDPREPVAKMTELHRKEKMGEGKPIHCAERFRVGGGVTGSGKSHSY